MKMRQVLVPIQATLVQLLSQLTLSPSMQHTIYSDGDLAIILHRSLAGAAASFQAALVTFSLRYHAVMCVDPWPIAIA
jgi:hypothetical protein